MNPEKIIKPLDELVGYIENIPLIIEPFPRIHVNAILSEIRKINGKVNNVFYRNNIAVEIKLRHIHVIAANKDIKKLKFNGNVNLLQGLSFQKNDVIDVYIEEILHLSESTPIIIHIFDMFDAKDKEYFTSICKKFQEHPSIKNAYSANIPLGKIEELTNMPSVSSIQYHKRVFARDTTKTFLPSTFW